VTILTVKSFSSVKSPPLPHHLGLEDENRAMHNSIVIFEIIGSRPKLKTSPVSKPELEISADSSKSEQSEQEEPPLDLEAANEEESEEEKEFPQNFNERRIEKKVTDDEVEESEEEVTVEDQIKLLIGEGDNMIDDEVSSEEEKEGPTSDEKELGIDEDQEDGGVDEEENEKCAVP
jgi:hypothetical protein